MVQRALNKWVRPGVAVPVTGEYDEPTQDRVTALQLEQKIKPAAGDFGQRTLDALWPYFDAYGRMRYRLFRSPADTTIGPVWKGGQSLLDHDLTHATDGLALYPAFDDGFSEGLPIIAPEALIVTRPSHSRPGLAFYATGRSRLQFWFGHLDRSHAAGARFKRGQMIGRVAPNTIGGGPHVHVGVNVELLLGQGEELLHHTNYTHGAPTIREQLARADL